ncbi:MAG: phosphoglycerate dehydrogenase-like enzyme, partial [Gammaproteobacteria bacterium]
GKRVGCIGFGHIAREATKRLEPFGVDIWARTRSPEKVDKAACAPKNVGPITELDSMLEACEFIIVTCPLTEQTRGLIDARRLALMGANSVLINVARGPIVDENALYEALSERVIGGAVIDTWYDYPDPSGNPESEHRPSTLPFHTLDNITMSSHASGWTDALFQRRFDVIADNLERLRKGEPLHNILRASNGGDLR